MPETIASGEPVSRALFTTILDCTVDSVQFARAFFAGRDKAFWLDGGPNGRSLFGCGEVISGDNTLAVIDQEIRESAGVVGAEAGPKPGFVGWIPYGFAQQSLGIALDRESDEEPLSFIRAERVAQIDNQTGAVVLVVTAAVSAGDAALADWRRLVSETIERVDRRIVEEIAPTPATVRWSDDASEYADKIARCQAEIASGNAYVLCLTTQVVALGEWNDISTFVALRASSRSHHAALIRIGTTSLVSASPERFIEVTTDRAVRTRPIKGTRSRSAEPGEDLALRNELEGDEKERSENLMIVDLMRNDLARICEIGTVAVEKLFDVESYPHVHQLVSTITGKLRDSVGVSELISALFPAGSMTGAPKAMAVRLLNRMESAPRGIYAGAFGFIGIDGTMDLAMTIRSVVISASHRATIGTGGGVTAMSDPVAEIAEMHLKAAASLAALRERRLAGEPGIMAI